MAPDPKPKRRAKDRDLLKGLHLELHGEPCERCGLRPGRELHHKKFRSHGGDDSRENLLWLCVPCHQLFHGF